MPARDAFRLLAKLASRPDLFDAVEADAARAADFLIRKQLSSGGLTPARLRALHDAVGGDALSRSVSRLSKTAATEIVKRLDRANPACRGAPTGIDPCWARARILALAGGAARPVVARKAEARPDAPSAAALSAALAAALRRAEPVAPEPAAPDNVAPDTVAPEPEADRGDALPQSGPRPVAPRRGAA